MVIEAQTVICNFCILLQLEVANCDLKLWQFFATNAQNKTYFLRVDNIIVIHWFSCQGIIYNLIFLIHLYCDLNQS